jgi:hypothetical protein
MHISYSESARWDGTFSPEDFTYDRASDVYVCPAGKTLTTGAHWSTTARRSSTARASSRAMPAPSNPAAAPRNQRGRFRAPSSKGRGTWPRHIGQKRRWPRLAAAAHEGRDPVRALEPHPPPRPAEAARPERCPRRVPPGRDRSKPPQTSETDHPANAAAGDLSAGQFGRPQRGARPSRPTTINPQPRPFSTESAIS